MPLRGNSGEVGLADRWFIGLETAAVRSLEVALVRLPALLQTPDYTRALLRSAGPIRSTAQIENECEVRSIRQRRLTDGNAPLELSVIMDEGALRKPVGGAQVMRDQFRHLVDMAEREVVTILVLPDSGGVHPGMGGAFAVLEFEDDADPDTLVVPYVTDSLRIEKPGEVMAAKGTFDDLRSIALPPVAAMDFVRTLGVGRYSM